MWDKLNTLENRKRYPAANYREWVPCEHVANLLKMWAAGDNRPENGSFIGFKAYRKGKEVYPEYY